jgi:hypothetical protein
MYKLKKSLKDWGKKNTVVEPFKNLRNLYIWNI